MDAVEIERILIDTLEVQLWPRTQVDRLTIAEAAHAIAEKLREGVVWEGTATVRRTFDEAGPSEVSYNERLEFDEIRPAWLSSVPDGERVRVTVTKEEGDES